MPCKTVNSENLTNKDVEYLYHHLFLPAKLPDGNDNCSKDDKLLIGFVHQSLESFIAKIDPEAGTAIKACSIMIGRLQESKNIHGFLSAGSVPNVLQQLSPHVAPAALFHVPAQNSGIFVYRTVASVTFETFELSPSNKDVMETRGRLVRRFPANATEILYRDLVDVDFEYALATTLAKMSHQTVKETKHKVKKANQEHVEDRETVHPRIVVDLLPAIVQSVGKQVSAMGISKKTHEEVMWSNSKLPWRRSPLWLLIRVGLQLTMVRLSSRGRDIYKEFMVFLLAEVLAVATKHDAGSDELYTMSAKICRRLCKLDHPPDDQWLTHVRRIVSETSQVLAHRWDYIRMENERPLALETIKKFKLDDSIQLSLPETDTFITSISEREETIRPVNFSPVAYVQLLDDNCLPTIETGEGYLPFRLAMLESWVAANLELWLKHHIGEDDACKKLKELIQSYHHVASRQYSDRPEGASRMLLTIGELWVAMDKAAIHAIHSLALYESEVPIEIWQALLLTSGAEAKRLDVLEKYFLNRQCVAQEQGRPSIFTSYGRLRSFSTEYFSASLEHQQLKARIEAQANSQREAKKMEYRRLKEEHSMLMEKYHDRTECDGFTREAYGTSVWNHSPGCLRCWYLNRAQNLQIDVHEWPLPQHNLDAQSTVFELSVPAVFSEWRDGTLYLINDVLLSEQDGTYNPQSSYPLRDYSPLREFFQTGRGYRIHLLSETKPHMVTHRRTLYVHSCVESDVCVNNGLRYQYFDGSRGWFLGMFLPTEGISDLCTFSLPGRAIKLKRFLKRTWLHPEGEYPNEVIASQFDCPEYMSLSEYKALAELPYGYNIQWQSILSQLAMPRIDLNKMETAIFLLQMSLQAGPRSSAVTRCTHTRISDHEFGRVMLENLTKGVSRIRENWESYTALLSLTSLASRVLSQVPSDLVNPFIELIDKCRDVAYRWLDIVLKRAETATDEAHRRGLLGVVLNIALVCVDSFNVDDFFLAQVLADSNQASILLECSIIIHNNAPVQVPADDPLQNALFDRWRHTMHRARDVLVAQRDLANSCFNTAVKRCWPAFVPASTWALVEKTCHWLQTTTREGLCVHIDILAGELLVNGSPLARLPREYERHDSYKRLFGGLILEVMPSNILGMRFCTKQQFQGHTVHFGMQDQDLLIRLEAVGSHLDLIPPRTLRELLPHSFVDEYSHWYHVNTGTVEFRLLKDPWTQNPSSWFLSRSKEVWTLRQGSSICLLAPCSEMARYLAAVLSPLEGSLYIYMLYDQFVGSLEIHVPRLQLDFFIKAGESIIRSRQFRGMHIDPDQSLGTLVGFTSKIILRNDLDVPVRMLIVPEGPVHIQRLKGHVTAAVAYGTARRIQNYRIDELLQRLAADTKLESKLFLAYIHALTSFCLPDPFLGRTGTEEAIRLLGSASVRAPGPLSPTEHDRLQSIAHLSPVRAFYPEHERVMQQVSWSSDLGFLAQDDRFYTITKGIIDRSAEIGFLYPDTDKADELSQNTIELVERAILRKARQCVSGYGAEDFSIQYDVIYQSRDNGSSDRAARAAEMAIRAHRGDASLLEPVASGLSDHLYTLLSHETITSLEVLPLEDDLLYDSKWLSSPSTFLSAYWCQIHQAFRCSQSWISKSKIMFWIATMTYSSEYDQQVTQALLSIALSSSVSAVPLPSQNLYELVKGYEVSKARLDDDARSAAISFDETPASHLIRRLYEKDHQLMNRRSQEYRNKTNHAVELFKSELSLQWPCENPRAPSDTNVTSYINTREAMRSVVGVWRNWYDNREFRGYLARLIEKIKELPVKRDVTNGYFIQPSIQPTKQPLGSISVDDLFHHNQGPTTLTQTSLIKDLLKGRPISSGAITKLNPLLDFLDDKAKLVFERRYMGELRKSLASLKDHMSWGLAQDHASELLIVFQEHLVQCETNVKSIYEALLEAVNEIQQGVPVAIQQAFQDIRCRPRVCTAFFLEQLKTSQWSKLPKSWQNAIAQYGLAITALQQAKRLVLFSKDEADLIRELENSGHQGWSVHEYPEWLLLECESEIMIRQVQQQIARQMMQPPDGENISLQLNMGEGKSSVIVPIVVSAQGNGSRLVRVIVAKPQSKQMQQMLVSKLAGMLDRPVYQLPFSRDIRLNESQALTIHKLATSCMQEGGILLVQPEHLLSFQLMELECHSEQKSGVAHKMMEIRRFFDEYSIDVVDEIDENLSVKFELVYTVGQQRPIDHSPDRWRVIQEVLGLVFRFCTEAKGEFLQSLDITDQHPGRVPRVRILGRGVEATIFERVATFICETGMDGFPISHQPPAIRDAVFRYITQLDLPDVEADTVKNSSFWHESTESHLLLLRGLFASGVLAFAFVQKRWRVNYGLDPSRKTGTKLAVPFRAKDNPTPRSEFSHPDVVIVLTCLSYYYGGLDDEALFTIFNLLVRSDDADQEYQDWVKTTTMPHAFRHLQGVNLKDYTQCTLEVFPYIRFSKAAIDYFLSQMVFAKECKEFPFKLSASGWDLGKKKSNVTTGFSGTNDSRYVLPLDMKQLDLPEQKHTNALVLNNLLRPENTITVMSVDMTGTALNSRYLLTMATKMSSNIRVILDVGAQIVDLTNLEFCKEWLKCYDGDDHTRAVVFFDDSDNIMVLNRSGKIEELQRSPFADQLDQCLVFLDEAHTRGTDLRLPTSYRAAVTLGANLTKDRLVQACMRMRKLGKGQSVEFCIPREIEQKIISLTGRVQTTPCSLTVSDVLCWAISETCQSLRREVLLWLTQGVRFDHQRHLWDELNTSDNHRSRLASAQSFKEEEALSLDRRYNPQQSHPDISSLDRFGSRYGAMMYELCQQFGLSELRTSSLQEEQERELSPEAEQESQVERPPPAQAARHSLHPDVRKFVQSGVFTRPTEAFQPAFSTLHLTSAAKTFDVREFQDNVWATKDFSKVVEESLDSEDYSDEFQRSVQWVLTSKNEILNERLLIISPYEAQTLLPDIEKSQHVSLRLYMPWVNRGFQSLDHLNLYNVPQTQNHIDIPQSLIIPLDVFSGQLYLSNYSDYIHLCDFLGLAWKAADGAVGFGPDGWISPAMPTSTCINRSGLSKSPVPFLKILFTKIRQECQSIRKSHMGKILEGVRLHMEDWAES
ncbi:hypothetical protein FPSE_10644 [Fusarium pseudograminearum CS3096]|uniref:ubiquitinyl hydrolase 1 n=1 Tax=Fusarium pseudograminearum (strain CS3096) TaxID=1028729 RepID=K3V7K2_FUSPC|nr:hypothetical protein FPSE_10644 [Fusarium pseudograminearum CS3096]EKJ69179.1 hypothetical protein FPSE_10644 [Fusarium pseudograminearum CS3096]